MAGLLQTGTISRYNTAESLLLFSIYVFQIKRKKILNNNYHSCVGSLISTLQFFFLYKKHLVIMLLFIMAIAFESLRFGNMEGTYQRRHEMLLPNFVFRGKRDFNIFNLTCTRSRLKRNVMNN